MSSFDTPAPPYNASDPTATFVNTSCLDLLLIELVPLAYRLANELDSSDRERDGPAGYASIPNESGTATEVKRRTVDTTAGSTTGTAGTTGGSTNGTGTGALRKGPGGLSSMDEDEERDAVFWRLESLGYRVGQGLVERYVHGTSRGELLLMCGTDFRKIGRGSRIHSML